MLGHSPAHFGFGSLYRLNREVIRDTLDSSVELEWRGIGRVFYTVAVILDTAHSFGGKDEGHGDIDVDLVNLLPTSIQVISFKLKN
jgi:hypothetical protein